MKLCVQMVQYISTLICATYQSIFCISALFKRNKATVSFSGPFLFSPRPHDLYTVDIPISTEYLIERFL